MLLLTSVNDQLQLVTSSTAVVHVHASWVDTNAGTGTITPGRTNTNIAAAATTSVAGSPAAGVQRNIKTLHVRNADATNPCTVTVQHSDGTIVAQLHKRTLQAGDYLEYTDQGGFAPTSGAGQLPTQQVFLSGTGTYTTPVGCRRIEVMLVGGGQGGSGGWNESTYPPGGLGSNTVFGPATAFGGGQSGGPVTGCTWGVAGGQGGIFTSVNIQNVAVGIGGEGGNSMLGGGGGVGAHPGQPNTGGGGAGGNGSAVSATGAGGIGGNAGASGFLYINNPAATYGYTVGAGGFAGPAGGYASAGAAGGSGIIVVKEFY